SLLVGFCSYIHTHTRVHTHIETHAHLVGFLSYTHTHTHARAHTHRNTCSSCRVSLVDHIVLSVLLLLCCSLSAALFHTLFPLFHFSSPLSLSLALSVPLSFSLSSSLSPFLSLSPSLSLPVTVRRLRG